VEEHRCAFFSQPGPHPSFPQNVFVEQGEVSCHQAGPGCAGPIEGVIHAWFQFDENGEFIFYREDAVLGSGLEFVYNREIATPKDNHEYFLINSSTPELICVLITTGITYLNGKFPNATYSTTGEVDDTPVYIWKDTWSMMDQPIPIDIYVAQSTGKLFGWSLAAAGGPTYIFRRWMDLGTTNPLIFVGPANIMCFPALHTARNSGLFGSLVKMIQK